MTPTLIVDCSMAMAWCFSDERTPRTTELLDRLLDEAALVPAHWHMEVANVLVNAERRKRITVPETERFLKLVSILEIHLDDLKAEQAFDRFIPLCRTHILTSYDAAYLELALRTRLPLASLDNELRRAAAKLGIRVLGK